jgi:hypothetical protein
MRKTFSLSLPRRIAGCLLIATVTAWAQAPQKPQTTQPPQTPQAPPAAPAKTNDPQAAALDLLRKVIAEQQKNPDKIIRLPPASPPVRESKAPSNPTAPRLSRAELERQFLEGKITAKQFQRAAEDLERNPPPPTPPSPAPNAVVEKAPAQARDSATAALSPKAASALPGKVITNQPSATPAPATASEDAPEQKALSDVEAKIDEILARRNALSQAAKTNDAATNAATAGPLTKRQKLDGLLRQLIQGKITEQEYKAQREKVMAQPD